MKKQTRPDERINVRLDLPPAIRAALGQLAGQGILGDTEEEVALHMLRSYLFQLTIDSNRPTETPR